MRAEILRRAGRAAALALVACGTAAASEGALERAVQAEISRAKSSLRDEGYPGAYRVALNIWDLDDWSRWSAMGAPRAETRMSQRIVLADVRVGGPALDNHPVVPKTDYQGTPVALSDDEFALRHVLWRILDGAYKSATADYLRKQARLVSQGKADYDTDDLAYEPPVVSTSARPASPWDLERLKRLEEALSEPFRQGAFLLSAESRVSLHRLWLRRRDTEGSAVDKPDDVARIEIDASALSPDGLRETVARDWLARTPEGLPTEAEMRRAGREMLRDLQELRVAATTSPFSAPALLDPSVSAALVYAVGQRLSGEEQRNPSGSQTYRGRVGVRVLSADLTLVDDPTRESYRGKPLFGHYDFDDEGVPARPVVLIERGLLKGFLLSRYPVKGFNRSNGHARAPVGQPVSGVPGSLFLTSANPQTLTNLLSRLREECRRQGKPYGLWVRDLRAVLQQQGGGGQGSIRLMARVDLVPADGGKPLRVRDLDLVGTPLVMAESALAAGDDAEASEINSPAASIVAPSLLLSAAELQRSETKPEKAPVLAPPQPFVPLAEHAAAPASGGFLQVDRYLLTGAALLESFSAPGVCAWRQTVTPDGIVLDVKIVGRDVGEVAANVRKVDSAAAALVRGGAHKTVLWPARPLASFRARYEDDWPDDGPR